jgi:hypothetical protein
VLHSRFQISERDLFIDSDDEDHPIKTAGSGIVDKLVGAAIELHSKFQLSNSLIKPKKSVEDKFSRDSQGDDKLKSGASGPQKTEDERFSLPGLEMRSQEVLFIRDTFSSAPTVPSALFGPPNPNKQKPEIECLDCLISQRTNESGKRFFFMEGFIKQIHLGKLD